MKEPCSLKTARVARKRQLVLRGVRRSGCRYATIWTCQGNGDYVRRMLTAR